MSEESKKPRYTQKAEVIDGVTYRYFADGIHVFSQGKEKQGKEVGYWEWYRKDGTLKRSGYFDAGQPVGEWTTYDTDGKVYKVTEK